MRSGENITYQSIDDTGDYPVYGGNGLRGFTDAFTHDGDLILLGRQGAWCGNIHLASGKFWASEHAVVVTPRPNVCVRWLGEVLRTMNLRQYSQTAAQPGLSVEFVENLSIPLPPLPEQQAIAAFLDRETAKIDALVEKKRRLIGLLKEKRAALISHAVTKGLNPDVPMKDSGIEWLGEVPRGWKLPPLYARYRVELGKMLDAKRITGNYLLPYLRNIDVQWDHVNVSDLPEMDIEPDEYERFTLRHGDLLVCEGGEVGRTAIWRSELATCAFQKAIHRLRPVGRISSDVPRYLYYVMRCATETGIFVAAGNPNTIPHLTAEKLRLYRFPFPPGDEQQAIVEYLDKEGQKSGLLISRVKTAIDRLLEYRTALISAAVTGKIDVRGEIQ